jgi:hypothetical protein
MPLRMKSQYIQLLVMLILMSLMIPTRRILPFESIPTICLSLDYEGVHLRARDIGSNP